MFSDPNASLRTSSLIALLICCAWALGLSLGLQGLISGYHPLADEWALLAHSHPWFAEPRQWFSEGFADYFTQPEGFVVVETHFIRPVFNFCYWLLGLFLAPLSGAYLYLNYFVIGACSGLSYLCMCKTQNTTRVSLLLLALCAPLMPSLIPSLGVLGVPCLAYDPLVACFCLLAWLGYTQQRYLLTGLALLVAVFTKETALPIALALPLHFLYQASCERKPWATLGRPLLLLGSPLLIWITLRFAAFGSIGNGVYVLSDSLNWLVLRAIYLSTQWPYWRNAQDVVSSEFGSGSSLIRYTLLGINILTMATIATIAASKLWRKKRFSAAEFCLFSSYGLMLVAGVSARYGVVFSVFLLLSIAQWQPVYRLRMTVIVLPALIVALLITNGQAWQNHTQVFARWQQLHGLSKQLVTTLESFDAKETVLVINDPITMTATMDSLTKVANIKAKVSKISDFVCPHNTNRLDQSCPVTWEKRPSQNEFIYQQACGIQICNVHQSANWPEEIYKDSNIHVSPVYDAHSQPPVTSLRLSLKQPNLRLLYFDPETRRFKTRLAH